MCERGAVRHILAVLLTLLVAPAPAAAAAPLDLRLVGSDHWSMLHGEERDALHAGDGRATIVIYGRLGCDLAGAHCEALHGHPSRSAHCEDAFGHGTLRVPGRRAIRFRVSGQRCPVRGADVERGVLIARSGLLDYAITAAPSGRVVVRVRAAAARTRSDLACPVCRYLVAIVRSTTHSHASEAEITAAVEHACRYFPTDYQHSCSMVVDDHGLQLIRKIHAGLEAEAACRAVHACADRRSVSRRAGRRRSACG